MISYRFATLSMFATQLFVGLTALVFASVMPLVAQDLGVSAGQMQYQAALSYVGVMLAQIVLMILSKKVGIKKSYLAGVIAGSMFFLLLTQIKDYRYFMFVLLLSKCGFALAYVCPVIVMKKMNFSPKVFTSNYGMLVGGFTLGTMFSPTISAWVADLYSWQHMIYGLCLLSIVLCGCLWVYVPTFDKEQKQNLYFMHQRQLLTTKVFGSLIMLFSSASNYLVAINYGLSLLLYQHYKIELTTAALLVLLPNIVVVISSFSVRYWNRYFNPDDYLSFAAYTSVLVTLVLLLMGFMGFDHPALVVIACCCYGAVRGFSQPNIVSVAVNRLDFDSEIIMPSLVMWSAIPTIMMSLFIASLPDNFIGFTSAFIVLACVHILGLLFYRSEMQTASVDQAG